MGKTCERCSRTVERLFAFKDASASVRASLQLGKFEIVERKYCRRCMYEANGLYYYSALEGSVPFNLRSLRGKIAQRIVETIFLHFNWIVYPFGYESYFTNIIQGLISSEDASSHQLRAMPDLVVFKPPLGPGALLEVKGTMRPEGIFWLSERDLDKYLEFWKASKIAVFSIPDFSISAVPVAALEGEELPRVQGKNYLFEIDLKKYGQPLAEHFGFDLESYDEIMNYIAKETRHFLGGSYGLDL